MPRARATKTAATEKKAPSPAKPAEPQSPPPEPTDDLEIRLGNRIVFLQQIARSSYALQFSGGHVTLYAATPDAGPLEEATDLMVPADVSDATPDEPDEPEVNPDVRLQVHTGDRKES